MHYLAYRGAEQVSNYGWTGMLGGAFMMIFWFVVIFLIISLVRRPHGMGHHCMGEHVRDPGMVTKPDPLEIIKERYARGEIDRKEYEEKKKDLS